MVPTLIMIVVALAAAGGLFAWRAVDRRAATRVKTEGRDYWWRRRRMDRDDILERAEDAVARGEFRARRPGESPWSYAKVFHAWTSSQFDLDLEAPWSHPFTQIDRPMRRRQLLSLPSLPPMPKMGISLSEALRRIRVTPPRSSTTWTEIRAYWWTTDRDGVVHRVGAIKHDGQESFVLYCDHDERVDPLLVDQHLEGEGPLLTCVLCFSLPRAK